MKTRLYRGLIGKERKIRQRNRVSRFFQDQLVADFYNKSDDKPRPRRIPIRHRSEFLPTALNAKRKNIESQMELPLESKQVEYKPGFWKNIWTVSRNLFTTPVKLVTGNQSIQDQVIRFTRRKKVQIVSAKIKSPQFAKGKEWQPVHLSPRIWTRQTRTQRTMVSFSLGGVAYGCVLGGATAAFVLMLIGFVLG